MQILSVGGVVSAKQTWSLALIMVTAIWGWCFVAKQQSLQGMSASSLNTWIFFVGASCLGPFAIRDLANLPARDWMFGRLAGAILFVAFSFQTSGIGLTTPSNAGFMTGFAVVFTPLLLFVLFKETPTFQQWAGGAIALIGLALFSLNDLSLHLGDALILCCAVFFAAHIVALAKLPFSGTPVSFCFVQLVTVGVLSGGWSVSSNELVAPMGNDAWLTMLLLAVFGTALAYFVQTSAQSVMSTQMVALILLFEPIFSALFGYALAGDRMTATNISGAVLIIAGMAVSELGAMFKRRKSAPTGS
jgi:drug/metabolite transporter (DMT)-like permease